MVIYKGFEPFRTSIEPVKHARLSKYTIEVKVESIPKIVSISASN